MKKLIITLLAMLMLLASAGCGGSSGGDGVSTCRNCGRSKKLVAGYGYCYSCYEGFRDWQKRQND